MTNNNFSEERTGHLCTVCSQLDLTRYLFKQEDPGSIQLGSFQDIARRDHCPFCRLIIQALSLDSRDYWQKGIYPVEICYIGRNKGIPRLARFTATPSVVRLGTWFTATSSTLPRGFGYFTHYGEILQLEYLSAQKQEVRARPGRLVDRSEVNISLIRKWIHSCEHHHGSRCNPEPGDLEYIRLIDVEEIYVWGNVEMFQTLQSNLSELEMEGSLLRLRDKLPPAINDSISFVSMLQEKFLWVDTLCIVQDDNDDKQFLIPKMGNIYSQAALTIVALSGNDANTGLPGVRKGSRSIRQVSEIVHGCQLSAQLPELSSALQKSRWDTRAWTFQEMILSRRCLYFSDEQIYFQCRTSYYSEDLQEEPTLPGHTPRYLTPFEASFIGGNDACSPSFNTYESSVKQYSRRGLTYYSDSLNAYLGIVNLFEDSFGWKFASALTEHAFDLALLWKPMVTAYVRPRGASKPSLAGTCTSPTWCWTAWMGPVFWDTWRTNSYVGKKISLITEIEQFIIADASGCHKIARSVEKISAETVQDTKKEAESYLLSNEVDKAHIPSDIVLFFKAFVTEISNFRISPEEQQPADNAQKSPWLKPRLKYNVPICDRDGRRCGILYALNSDWTQFHDPNHCELVLLSRCGQSEIRPVDVDAAQDALPPEHPSSEDYYNEVFEASYFQYTEFWALNVMLIEWKDRFATRMAIGQIHADGWRTMLSALKMIALV